MTYTIFNNKTGTYAKDRQGRMRRFKLRESVDKAQRAMGGNPRYCVRLAPLSEADLASNAALVKRAFQTAPTPIRQPKRAMRRAA